MTQGDNHIQTILNGCKKGDRKAQEQLYRSFYAAMMNICVRYTRNEQDAMLALNTGFLKVFRSIDKYDAERGSLFTWIRKIVVNQCLDHIRTNNQHPATEMLDNIVEPGVGPDIFEKISKESILEKLRLLPPATRAVFNLFAVEGYGHKEIAAMLKISEGTSKWHFAEARKKLKQLIEPEIKS